MHASLLNTTIGPYVLGRVIASGGMAAIYRAEHTRTGEQVAIKVLGRDLRGQIDPLARLLQEGRIIRSLLHEHIVKVIDYGTVDDEIGYVVMECLEGQTLHSAIYKEGPLEPARVVSIGRQICQGLSTAHARGVFHRDVKPSNIMLVKGQRHRDFVKLLDFGIAHLRPDDPAKLAATATGMTLGTPQYMSPEQASAQHIDARSDIYQLGLVLYEMLTGDPPFNDPNPVMLMGHHLATAPAPIRGRQPNVSLELEAVVLKCLEKAPDDRYESAKVVRIALDRLARRDSASVPFNALGQPVVADLRLPSLGSPADLERYARNLGDVLGRLWGADVPQALRGFQATLWTLTEAHVRLGTDLAIARAHADQLAQALESRQQPIERALAALETERTNLDAERQASDLEGRALHIKLDQLDAEYARVYEAIEVPQAALFERVGQAGGLVDFREMFRDDIKARLDRLHDIFRNRAQTTTEFEIRQETQATLMPQVADLNRQLVELQRSRLAVEAMRVGDLAELEFKVADLDRRHRAAARTVEHQALQLGLAFRSAVSDLLNTQDP